MKYFYPRVLLAFLSVALIGNMEAWSQWHVYTDGKLVRSVAEMGNYIWAGSMGGGLVRVDKTSKEKTYFNRSNSELRSVNVTAVLRDGDKLWIGTDGQGLHRFDGVSSWEIFRTKNSPIPHNKVNGLYLDKQGNLWIPTDGGLAKRNTDGTWQTWTTENGLPDNKVTAVSIGTDGALWIGTLAKGFAKFINNTWTVYRKATYEELTTDSVTAINADVNGKIWVGFGNANVMTLNGQVWEGFDLTIPVGPGMGTPYRPIYEIKAGAGNDIYFSTYTGLARFDGTGVNRITPASGLASEAVYSSLIDTEGNIWAGTHEEGLAVKKGSSAVQYIQTSNTNMRGNSVTKITVSKDGVVWFGTQGGAQRFDRKTGQWRVYDNTSFGYGAIHQVAVDSVADTANVWFAKDERMYRLRGNRMTSFPGAVTGTSGDFQSVSVAPNGDVWVGAVSSVARLRGTSWTAWSSENSSLPPGGITDFAFDKNGNVWLGTSFGNVGKFDGSTWTAYRNTDVAELGSGAIGGIAADPVSGAIWVGTGDAGLVKYDGTTWTGYNTFNSGISSDIISTVSVDMNGNVWAGTVNQGLVKYENNVWRSFTIENSGLTEDRINSIWVSNDKKIWIATPQNGFVMYDDPILGVDNGIRPVNTLNILAGSTPNPFNGSTAINLNLPSREQVRLSVMNARGEEVAILKDGQLEAGEHRITFNALDLPSGIYFTRLVVNGVVESQPVVLTR